MTQAQTVIATWLMGVLEQFAAQGLGTRGWSEGAWLHDACRQAPTRQLNLVIARRLWQQAAQQSGDPLLGLKVGAALPLQAMNVVAWLVMQSASLRQALALTVRYQSLVSNSGQFTAQPIAGGLRLAYQVTPCPVAMHASQIDSVFAGYLSLLGHCAPPGVRPRTVALPGQSLQLRAAYEAQLGCPVVLGAQAAWFEFDDEALDRPFLAADPQLLRLAQARADDMLRAQGHADSLIDHVQAALADQGFGSGSCVRVARRLGLSTRTLQRRLAAAATSSAGGMRRRALRSRSSRMPSCLSANRAWCSRLASGACLRGTRRAPSSSRSMRLTGARRARWAPRKSGAPKVCWIQA